MKKSLSAIFSDGMTGAIHTTLDPASGIPPTWARKVVAGEVKPLKYRFFSSRFRAGSDNAIVVGISGNLQGDLGHFLIRFGILECKNDPNSSVSEICGTVSLTKNTRGAQ